MKKYLVFVVLSVLFFSSCKDDSKTLTPSQPVSYAEQIKSLKYLKFETRTEAGACSCYSDIPYNLLIDSLPLARSGDTLKVSTDSFTASILIDSLTKKITLLSYKYSQSGGYSYGCHFSNLFTFTFENLSVPDSGFLYRVNSADFASHISRSYFSTYKAHEPKTLPGHYETFVDCNQQWSYTPCDSSFLRISLY